MSHKSKKSKKDKPTSGTTYVTTPLLYVLLSCIIIIPLGILLLNFTVQGVHKALPSFSRNIYDIEVRDEVYQPSSATTGDVVKAPRLRAGYKVGELTCESVGLNTAVYYGANRVSYRNGVGLCVKSPLPGENGVAEIHGTQYSAFRTLPMLKTGDKLRLSTSYGEFVYTVSEIVTAAQPPDATMPQCLLLMTACDSKMFSNYNEEKLYIMAELESGPQLEEVQ